MAMKYAQVQWWKKKIAAVRRTEDIVYRADDGRPIIVIDSKDFEPTRKYYGKWFTCGGSGEKCEEEDCPHDAEYRGLRIMRVGGE